MGEPRRDRVTDAPISMDVSGSVSVPLATGVARLAAKLGIPQSWIGMSGYLLAGIFLGLVLIFALGIGRDGDALAAASPNAVRDNVVRLGSRELGSSCWQGYEKTGPARLTVALEVGIDGKIRYAAASGETPAMRSCLETHVKTWQFLPQQQAQAMALPVEVQR